MKILVTGATGYIGGRLVPRLLESGHTVRVLVRDADRISGLEWRHEVEVEVGDLLDPEVSQRALSGVEAAYYLVHSMASGSGFVQRDRQAAEYFATAARQSATLEHLIYLGGLVPSGEGRSTHLKSRSEVGEILRRDLPTTEFRAGPIVGSGSASFEMVRYLTERLPAMIAPRWIVNRVQPVAVADILAYLEAALDRPPLDVVEVGTDPLSFLEMMKVYAEVRGMRRHIFRVPVLAPKLAGRWVGLVTPIPNAVGVPLIEGIVESVLADTEVARREFPEIEPKSYRSAVETALKKALSGDVDTSWSDALGAGENFRLEDREGLIREIRQIDVAAPPEEVFRTVTSLGGAKGWLVWNWAWRLRGALDALVGGPGLRRGRRHPERLRVGEAVDFWRVEAVEAPTLLRLRAEMKVPGRAWLEFEIEPRGAAGSRLTQTALFAPRGLPGAVYWYLLYPLHKIIFSDMVAALAKDAEQRVDKPAPEANERSG